MSDPSYDNFLKNAPMPEIKKLDIKPAHARVSSTLEDNEVERVNAPKATARVPAINLKMDAKPELGDGVDFAAAGVTDLNNFKGYHNQEANKNEEDERYNDPDTGAHFEFKDFCNRLIKLLK